MILNYTKKGQVTINMKDYMKTMINKFPSESLNENKAKTSWDANLFKVEENWIPLNQKLKEQCQKITYQALFLYKKGRPDIMPGIAFLTTKVNELTHED